jgi:hypothetical protein
VKLLDLAAKWKAAKAAGAMNAVDAILESSSAPTGPSSSSAHTQSVRDPSSIDLEEEEEDEARDETLQQQSKRRKVAAAEGVGEESPKTVVEHLREAVTHADHGAPRDLFNEEDDADVADRD